MKMSARNLPYVPRLQLVLNQFFAIPAALVVAATGIYQMDKLSLDYGDFWVSATITILVVPLPVAPPPCVCERMHRDDRCGSGE